MKRKISRVFFIQQGPFLIIDYLLSVISLLISLFSHYGIDNTLELLSSSFVCIAVFLIYPFSFIFTAYILSVYNILWRYADVVTYLRLAISAVISTGIMYVIVIALAPALEMSIISYADIPCSITCAILCFTFVSIVRCLDYYRTRWLKDDDGKAVGNVMIIGGGSAGSILVNDIKQVRKKSGCKVRCIIDDDRLKLGQSIHGIPVVGNTSDIPEKVAEYDIDTIVFAIPTCPNDRKAAILNICKKTTCKLMIIPSFYQLAGNTKNDTLVTASSLRDVQIEDLLGREPIDIDVDNVLEYISGKTVLVTGGGGSIGSELCRQISKHSPEKLIIFDIYENNAYDIQNELIKNCDNLDLTVLIGSVRDQSRLEAIFDKYKPNIVFHAAAHKHVPLMEDSPNESIKNNVFGTYNVAKCADKFGAQKFILISTDKAVNPTNIMGASKRICEMIIQYFSNHSKTEFAAVRFGNVLGSNGSVIPLFKNQIAAGGPVTVTDPNIIRYFMTIPEAVSLVLQAGATANGGEIFVLDMGEPVKIIDLAENLIRLSGFQPYTEIKIEIIGLRPGEKMYEEKLLSEEGLKRTDNQLIHIGQPIIFDEENFISKLEYLRENMLNDNFDVRAVVRDIVPTYNYYNESGC